MDTAISTDGTPIAYDTFGSGPGLILIAGAMTDRSYYVPLATALSSSFTVVTYDRRGRGDSGDSAQYQVEREWEDLDAVRKAAGAVYASADSSGAVLLLRAVAAGVPFEKVAIMEPPFRVEGAPPAPPRYVERLEEFIAAGNPGGAVEFFMVEAVGQPKEEVDGMKAMPFWAGLEAIAPTLSYDGRQMGDSEVPTELLKGISTPTLAVYSTGSPDWLKQAVRSTGDALPAAEIRELPGEFHSPSPEALVPALKEFYLG
ncbi:alpha-beta hydrolase superfamily lysophospholipase [Kribbella sp. VKM Ac-2527]|uniref:Alpha-beta hydrolase superfamily lysophospholipase n=1 Tax=Kribbella caucasensis TaxID=2512215 RepID=A0A4R6KAU8_9ACTN|nr:alpha/beta hydrolase [Kribbella sp. VKM Ac-2527]TDO47195.1 alpha-beta hydrolase superfamily lysophospholipase [Kribbella sp. VKM Ac-2527]